MKGQRLGAGSQKKDGKRVDRNSAHGPVSKKDVQPLVFPGRGGVTELKPGCNVVRFTGWVPCPIVLCNAFADGVFPVTMDVKTQVHKQGDRIPRWEVVLGPYAVYPAYPNNRFVGDMASDTVIQGRSGGGGGRWNMAGLQVVRDKLLALQRTGHSFGHCCGGECQRDGAPLRAEQQAAEAEKTLPWQSWGPQGGAWGWGNTWRGQSRRPPHPPPMADYPGANTASATNKWTQKPGSPAENTYQVGAGAGDDAAAWPPAWWQQGRSGWNAGYGYF